MRAFLLGRTDLLRRTPLDTLCRRSYNSPILSLKTDCPVRRFAFLRTGLLSLPGVSDEDYEPHDLQEVVAFDPSRLFFKQSLRLPAIALTLRESRARKRQSN